VRHEAVGDLHDADRVCGHAVIGDHNLARPKVAAAQLDGYCRVIGTGL